MATNLRVAVEFASRDGSVVASKSILSSKLTIGGSKDERYIRLLITRSQRLKLPPNPLAQKLPPSSELEDIDKCRACQLPVDMGDIQGIAKCQNGHHWCRSTVTPSSVHLQNTNRQLDAL